MPPIAKSANGKTSVCVTPALAASRSASLPGTAEARGVKASTPRAPTETDSADAAARSSPRSATSSADSSDTHRTVPCRNSVGPSIATDPTAADCLVPASAITATPAEPSAPKVSTRWAV